MASRPLKLRIAETMQTSTPNSPIEIDLSDTGLPSNTPCVLWIAKRDDRKGAVSVHLPFAPATKGRKTGTLASLSSRRGTQSFVPDKSGIYSPVLIVRINKLPVTYYGTQVRVK